MESMASSYLTVAATTPTTTVKSNLTGAGESASTTSAKEDTTYLFDIQVTVRVLVMLAHWLYFVIVLMHRKLKRPYNFLQHNVHLIGLILSVDYITSVGSLANFSTNATDNSQCGIDAVIRVVSRIARYYSVALLAVYRYLSLYKYEIYERITDSYLYLTIGWLVPWTLAILLYVAVVNIFSVSFYSAVCAEGYSTYAGFTAAHYALTLSIGYVLPTVAVCVLFALAHTRLREMHAKIGKRKRKSSCISAIMALQANAVAKKSSLKTPNLEDFNREREHHRSNSAHHITWGSAVNVDEIENQIREHDSERILSFQFLVLCGLLLLSLITQLIANLVVMYSTARSSYYVVVSFMMTSEFIQGAVPIVSLVLNPFKMNHVPCRKK